MSFLKLGRKKDKTRRSGEAVAPVTPLHTAGFSQTAEQSTIAEALTAHRLSEVSVSTPDIYHEFSSLTEPRQQRVSTPRKPKDYKRKRGIISLFSRKKSTSLPHLPTPQPLPPVPVPHPDGTRHPPQVKHFTTDTHTDTRDTLYQNDHYAAVRTSTPLQSSEEPYPLYSTVRTDPVTGTKATVRNVPINTPMWSIASSAPVGTDRASGEGLAAREISGGEYENQDPSRGPVETGEITSVTQDTATEIIGTKLDSSELEKTLQLLSRQQQQLLEINLQLQQRADRDKDTKSHATDAKQSEERHAKRQSRITADTDPTTSSLNHSADPANSLLPGNKVDGMQYYFVPGLEGNGYLLPVGPEGRPPSKHNALYSSVEQRRTELQTVRSPGAEQLAQYLQERQVELESKLVELTEQNAQLAAQVTVMSHNTAPEEMCDVTEIAYLRQECERLREISNSAVKREQTDSTAHRKCVECVYREKELVDLKKIVFRLNVELSRYQSLYGEHPLAASSLPLQQLGAESAPWLTNTSYLSPLLAAYDEQLTEKSSLLRELQAFVSELQGVSESLESRNSELERELTSRPLPDQLERSRHQLELLGEENSILSRDLHARQQELAQLRTRGKHELEQSAERVSRLEREAEKYKSHLTSAKSKLESERGTYSDKISSLKEQLHQTQFNSDSQCSKLQSKLREVAVSVGKKETALSDQKAAISVLEGKSSAAVNSVRALKQKISILERELEVSRGNELTAKGYLEDVVSLVERTAAERDTYARLASKHGHSSHNSSLQESSMKKRLDKLRETTQIRLSPAIKINSEQDSINESDKQTSEDELLHIRILLAEREREIIGLREARNTAEQKLDGILLSLPKQHTNSI